MLAANATAATTTATACTTTRGAQAAQAPCGCTLNSVPRKQVKSGYLMRYRKRLLGLGSWSERWFVLLDDSTLSWYKARGSQRPEGSVRVREAPDLLAVSEFTMHIPNCPTLPKTNKPAELLAVGIRRPRSSVKVVWTLARSMEECHEWMAAISMTLPPMPPPRPPPRPPPGPPSSDQQPAPTESTPPRSKRADMMSDGTVEMLPPALLLQVGHGGAVPSAVPAAVAPAAVAPAEPLWGGWGQGNGWVHVTDAAQFHAAAVLPHAGHGVHHHYQHDYHAPAAASTYHTDYGSASAIDMGGHDIDIGDVDLGGGIDCMADLCF